MKKINSLKKNKDFQRIIKNNKPFKYKGFIVYVENLDQDNYHFGISVSKKIGNAVVRNKIKRQIRDIISRNNYEKNVNCIIIVRKSYLEEEFITNSNDLSYIFKKLNIIG